MRVRDTQANEDATRWEGGDPHLSFLYFLFCIIESLGDLTDMPNSIFCKFSILENSCAQQDVCAHLYCVYVGVCTGVYVCVCSCCGTGLTQDVFPSFQIWQFWVFPGTTRAVGVCFWGTICSD